MSKITNPVNPVWHRMLYSCTHVATVIAAAAVVDLATD